MSYTIAASDRGMFDANLPLQGIFDNDIFDTELAVAVNRVIIPALVHGNEAITVLVHGNEVITI